MNVLDLFSGIGGFSLGLERAGMHTVAFCEIDPFCRAVLRKHWPDVPIFEDVRELGYGKTGHSLFFGGENQFTTCFSAGINLICGGFPCQPYSLAGKQLAGEDDRDQWPQCRRLIEELGPDWFVGENVVGIADLALDNVLADLEALGYACRTFDIPACAVGARHERRRVWIIAHAESQRLQGQRPGREQISPAHAEERLSLCGSEIAGYAAWDAEPAMARVVHGIPNRAHRVKALGNSIVPQIAEIIGRAILAGQPL